MKVKIKFKVVRGYSHSSTTDAIGINTAMAMAPVGGGLKKKMKFLFYPRIQITWFKGNLFLRIALTRSWPTCRHLSLVDN